MESRFFFSATLRHWVDPRGNDNKAYPRIKPVRSRFVSRDGSKRSEPLTKLKDYYKTDMCVSSLTPHTGLLHTVKVISVTNVSIQESTCCV